jgi:hypothetical protein
MSHILEQTDDHLVIKLSSMLGLTTAIFTLDRSTASIHVEKTKFFFQMDPIDIAFSHISWIEYRTRSAEDVTYHMIRLEYQSGERLWIQGGNAKTTADAATRMRDFLQLKESDRSNTPLARANRQKDTVYAVLGAIIIIVFLFLNHHWSS